ncbi:potassium voltage-gated channel subfamily A member 6-like isoform X2 [Bolinopsis microptera]|uniref:potassium voltage-gated channel subfamily A member 6-like isoform X2 n=1 Tax=Bolinopsis microptera TaxID=2820187 RepID=UPI00307A2239
MKAVTNRKLNTALNNHIVTTNSDKECDPEKNHEVKEQCVPDDDLVNINVSGTMYITSYTCLNMFPNTLLGNEERRKQYYSEKLDAYFFNRHRPCFDSILNYYQTGKEAPPLNVDPDVYAKEKEFFGIKKEREVAVFIPEGGGSDGIDCVNSCRMKVHNFLQDPRSSSLAAVWHGFDIIFICISIALWFLKVKRPMKIISRTRKKRLPTTNLCLSLTA